MSLAGDGIKRDSLISVRQQIVNASEKCPTSLIKVNGYDESGNWFHKAE